MKNMTLKRAAASALAGAMIITGTSASAGLKIGDKAPKLQPGKWVQGEPVKDFEKGKAYVVEFWATWCGPCRVSIPHLNETYTKFKDKGLVVIGQDCWERDESLVGPFVEKMGEKMTYRVALDDKSSDEKGAMASTWMEAAGQNGIPAAFLIDTRGKIAWIGHPMSLKEETIEKVLSGNFDTARAAAEYEEEQQNNSKLQQVWAGLNAAIQKKNWEAASEKLDEAQKLFPEGQHQALDTMRFTVLAGKGDYQAAYKLAEKVSDDNKSNADLQNELAWRIATDHSLKERDLKLAEKIARRANDATKAENPMILDTLARVMFMQGNKDEAIALQEKAIAKIDGSEKESYVRTLESYKKGALSKSN